MPKLEEKDRRSGWGVAPSSRHLWVGNLSPHVSQNSLYEHFLRFGDIENIAYTPGRSYAFVNYKKEEDAVIALRGLQGFIIAGNPLRVEFAKGVSDENPCLRTIFFSLRFCGTHVFASHVLVCAHVYLTKLTKKSSIKIY